MDYKREMQELYKQIEEAEKAGKNPAILYKRQIEILEESHKSFIEKARTMGVNLDSDLNALEMEIKHFKAMKQIAQKANFPTEKYDRYMRDARIRVLGEDFVKKYFN